jgi:glutathionyl-hydroquinone reductase
MTAVDPIRDERGWAFREGPGHSLDPMNGFRFLGEAYRATEPHYIGRFTVPVLWDCVTKRIVTNSDDDLMRIFNAEFNRFTESPIDLYPDGLRQEIDELNTFIYENVNDGVYRAGFATSQHAYERAARRLFAALDQLDARLATRRYLFGPEFVETDWRLLSRWFGSTRSITAISSAMFDGLSTTPTSPAIFVICTKPVESPTP